MKLKKVNKLLTVESLTIPSDVISNYHPLLYLGQAPRVSCTKDHRLYRLYCVATRRFLFCFV